MVLTGYMPTTGISVVCIVCVSLSTASITCSNVLLSPSCEAFLLLSFALYHQIHQPLLKFLLFLFDILFDIPTIHTSNINDTQISFDIYTSIHHLNLISIPILFVLL